MVRHSQGLRAKSRKKLTGGRFSIAEALQDFSPEEKVVININPAVHKGMPHPRFQGRLGKVTEKRGKSFVIEIKDGGKTKKINSKAEHLRALERRREEATLPKNPNKF